MATPVYFSSVSTTDRNGIFYQPDLNQASPSVTVIWKIGSVPIKSGH